MAEALSAVADLVRDYLPTTSRTYPAERLASEVDDLRTRWEPFN